MSMYSNHKYNIYLTTCVVFDQAIGMTSFSEKSSDNNSELNVMTASDWSMECS